MNYRNANNKRLHVEMSLIRLCYLLQAMQPGDEKKNSSNVAVPKAAAPQPTPVAPPTPEYKAPPTPAAQVQEPAPTPPPVVHNYSKISITGEAKQRKLSVVYYDKTGKKIADWSINEQELKEP